MAQAASTLLKFASAASTELEDLWPSHALTVLGPQTSRRQRRGYWSQVSREFRMPKETVLSLEMKREPSKEIGIYFLPSAPSAVICCLLSLSVSLSPGLFLARISLPHPLTQIPTVCSVHWEAALLE